jgi:hypothetical protein
MTITDLANAVEFLRRVVARGDQEEVLVRTVRALELEIERRQSERRNHAS